MAKAKKQVDLDPVEVEMVEDYPEVVSVTMERCEHDYSLFQLFVITTKGDKVVKVESEEPNLRPVVFDQLKIKVMRLFHEDFNNGKK